MQNAGLAALGLNWRYLAFEVHPDDLRTAIAGAKAMKFIGLNLTVPHKLLAVDMVDVLDDSARTWGAVNTIRFETRDSMGAWVPLHRVPPDEVGEIRSHGFNTDADALIRSIGEEFSWPPEGIRGASVLLLGAGGAARAAAIRLAQESVGALHLANRTRDKAIAIAKEIVERCPDFVIQPEGRSERVAAVESTQGRIHIVTGYSFDPVDIVINATSLGLRTDDKMPIDIEWLKSRRPKRVYDMIYRPAETPLLQLARQQGAKTANGLGMLLYQGAKALELWTEQTAPIAEMREALRKNVYG